MSKKILSIALAVVMLFSVLACTAGAANTDVSDTVFPTEGKGGFRVVTDAYVGMPAGEEVTVKVYWVHPVGTDYSSFLQNAGNVVIAYNGDAFKYNTTSTTTTGYDGRTWGSAYEYYLLPKANVNVSTSYSNNIIKALKGEDANQGWTKAMLVQLKLNSDNSIGSYDGWLVDPDCEIFSLSFTTNRKLEATDSIGLPSGKSGFVSTNGTKNTTYTADNIILSEAIAEPNVVSVNETATAKMRPGTAAGTVDLGLTGTFMNKSFTIDTSGDPCGQKVKNMSAVGAQARVNGVVSAADDIHIYETTDGYNFRIAIAGINAAGLGAQIEVRTYIITDKGTFFSNWMNIDATTVHENAVANNMPGII